MKTHALPILAASLLFLLPCAAAAQEDPEAVYAKFHRALIAGNLDDLNKYGTPGGGVELAKMPADQRKAVLDLMKQFVPASYSITGREPSPDPNRVALRATGMAVSLITRKPEPAEGRIVLHKLGAEWKVDQANWSSGISAAPPRAAESSVPMPNTPMQRAPQSRPAPTPTTPKASAPVLGTAREPCVYKPVMSNEDIERCR